MIELCDERSKQKTIKSEATSVHYRQTSERASLICESINARLLGTLVRRQVGKVITMQEIGLSQKQIENLKS